MKKLSLFLLFLVFSFPLLQSFLTSAAGTEDGSEQWGYIEVRPQAHLFWWLYKSPYRVEDPSRPWPTILWLQGGPGSSGVAFGNFVEIGPLDRDLQARNYTWLKKADLLFVDSPVAAGFSYVENKTLVVTTDEEAAADLTTLLKVLFNGNETLQRSPLYTFGESYGGKFAVTLGVSLLKAIEAGEVKLQLGGVALGDSWISPVDFTFSWGPLLKDLSRLNDRGLNISNSLASKIQQQISEGIYEEATSTCPQKALIHCGKFELVDLHNFYNFLLDAGTGPVPETTAQGTKELASDRHTRYLGSKNFASPNAAAAGSFDFGTFMNGPIRKKLKIIPENVTWGGQKRLVSPGLNGDFMKPRIQEVDELLAKGVNVTIYNGQVDLICSTKGTEAWVSKLKWNYLENFLSVDRTPLYCEDPNITKGFMSSYKNLFFYWILGAGHFVPAEQPCIALEMVGSITRSPNN